MNLYVYSRKSSVQQMTFFAPVILVKFYWEQNLHDKTLLYWTYFATLLTLQQRLIPLYVLYHNYDYI